MQPLCVSVITQNFLGEDQTSECKTKLCRTGVVTCVYNPRTEGEIVNGSLAWATYKTLS